MVLSNTSLKNAWDDFHLDEGDIEFIYSVLLEKEIPLPAEALLEAVIVNRIKSEKEAILKKTKGKGKIYLPKDSYAVNEDLVFPSFDWKNGKVLEIRDGFNPELEEFKVIKVEFEDGSTKELASSLSDHALNTPVDLIGDDPAFDKDKILSEHHVEFLTRLEETLAESDDLVQIAEAWFPRALLVNINGGYLNLIEAILEESGGGPMTTPALMAQIELNTTENLKLTEFSLNLYLQEDERFDEVGPSGEVLWYLHAMEPEDVKHQPLFLKYHSLNVENLETKQYLDLFEGTIIDELEPEEPASGADSIKFSLLFPHWRSGTLPLSNSVVHIFPTAIESPRIRFTFRDANTDQEFNGWVVRKERYVYGLKNWYEQNGIMPGSLITVSRSDKPGEILIHSDRSRQNKEWMKTVLVGTDKGIVFAMLKHPVEVDFNERMTIAIPDEESVDQVWQDREKLNPDKIFLQIARELAKLNPQGHIHAQEMYAAINVIFRCPPTPILNFLLTSPNIQHLGDLYFHLKEGEN
ncbi:MAG TPA: hypothetical protein DCK95_02785 [Anaerolineaceae bacterium]|uniref:Uncharacterized protein n=1 Tax=Anaerolinea thermophila TaxID=167964 RepID=A0A101FY18_9CHLR|nr:MAG: hypothetical protein XD73_0553 [Anaerolinea thermophila]HAF61233.1 hypothetical protein [Anaerolineaceae bacterium]